MQGTDTIAAERGNDKRPYMFNKTIYAVKASVRLEEYAREHTRLYGIGGYLRGAYPIHDGDNTSAFSVRVDRQRWHCFRCDTGGDVIDLCRVVEDHSETWTAMLSLAGRYGIELPQRPASYGVRQSEKAQDYERIFSVIREAYRRRFYRVFAPAIFDYIEDPRERRQEGERIWQGMLGPAHAAARRRMERGIRV